MAESGRKVLLLGSVKVGKSVLFERLTSGAVRERSVPGTRLVVPEGRIEAGLLGRLRARLGRGTRDDDGAWTAVADEPDRLLDAPGASSLLARGQDEQVSRGLLLSAEVDAILMVADAKNLRRSLALFLQVAEFGLPMVLDLNMTDEAESLGVSVDAAGLAERLGVEVNASVASEGHGVARLPRLLARASVPRRSVRFPGAVESALRSLEQVLAAAPVSSRALGLLLLVNDPAARALLEERFGRGVGREVQSIVERARTSLHSPLEQVIAEAFYEASERLVGETVTLEAAGPAVLNRFGRWAEHPVLGIPIALVVLAAAYLWIGELGATLAVDLIDRRLFQELLIPAVESGLEWVPWPLVRDAFIDPDFGLIPTGLFLALGIVLPVLFFFYFFFAVLEDSGYLPRISVLLDRLLRLMGLNGKGVLPLVLGLSCVTMAIITTRMLETRKQRVIASFLLLLGFPCAPLLAVMLIVLQPLHWSAAASLFGFLIVQLVLAGMIANRIVPGKMPEFILELAPMRRPRLGVVLIRTGRRTYQFLREALPIFLLASLVLFGLDRAGGLDALERVSRPLINGFLGLPDQAVQVFIKTFIRRENGAAELNLVKHNFDSVQVVVTLLVMTLLTPCVNSAIVLFKERGFKTALLMIALVMVYAVIAGGVMNQVLRGLGVDFG